MFTDAVAAKILYGEFSEDDWLDYLRKECERHECSECWQFQEPDYAAHPGRCLLRKCMVYSNSDSCIDFENRHVKDAQKRREEI